MLNPIEAEQLCSTAEQALRHGSISLLNHFPSLLKRIIRERLWEQRKVVGIGLVEMKNLRELITSKPRKGWGVDLDKVESIIRDDPEALRMFREATTAPHGGDRTSKSDIRTLAPKPERGTTRAYTLTRLHKEAPELYQQVVDGELSANHAAIVAGFRRKPTPPTPLDQLRAAWNAARDDERETFLREVTQ